MFKLILNLILTKANKKRWQLEIGTHLLKKGCAYQVGQIVQQKHLRDDLFRVKVITGIFYDFHTNKINHTAENKIIRNKK
jgi:hypothetical protein